MPAFALPPIQNDGDLFIYVLNVNESFFLIIIVHYSIVITDARPRDFFGVGGSP